MKREMKMANKAKKVANKARPVEMQIDLAQFHRISEYSSITGVPIDAAIGEALSDFIECCISVRLESVEARLNKA
jgi:hypothetical protein